MPDETPNQKLRRISQEELQDILEQHEQWLTSDGEKGNRAVFFDVDCSGLNLEGADLRGAFFGQSNFSHTNMYEAKLRAAQIQLSNFSETDLRKADFTNSEISFSYFYKSNFSYANMSNIKGMNIRLPEALMYSVKMANALLTQSDFEKAKIHKGDLRGIKFQETNMRETQLTLSDLTGSFLKWVDFSGALLREVKLDEANISGSNFEGADVTDISYENLRSCRGGRFDSCYGSPMFKRYAQDLDWVEEFISTRNTRWRKFWAWFWGYSSDFGQSIEQWILCSVALAVMFAVLYTPWPDWFWCMIGGKAMLWASGIIPDSVWDFFIKGLPDLAQQSPFYQGKPLGFWSSFYFSIVTFTTLGFGDIVANNWAARVLVTLEVIIGYVMLGGLISILATKLARRS
jgi:uncharacterized protein YjbI with pentapeptide repeats